MKNINQLNGAAVSGGRLGDVVLLRREGVVDVSGPPGRVVASLVRSQSCCMSACAGVSMNVDPAGCSPSSVLVSSVTTIFRLSSSLRRRTLPRHFSLWARMVAVTSNELSAPASSLWIRPVTETRQMLHHPLIHSFTPGVLTSISMIDITPHHPTPSRLHTQTTCFTHVHVCFTPSNGTLLKSQT